MVRFAEPLGEQYSVRAICDEQQLPDEAIEPMQRLGMVTARSSAAPAALWTTQIRRSKR